MGNVCCGISDTDTNNHRADGRTLGSSSGGRVINKQPEMYEMDRLNVPNPVSYGGRPVGEMASKTSTPTEPTDAREQRMKAAQDRLNQVFTLPLPHI
ncbi:hypothetical protein AYI69_g1489 [Smittium culicis]|uniref:Uncharacterized protein n=1 Tax=Smittium culicis TaxID=133412 RepID=A0A1R1YQ44_9FUNG|nr:hypothetical protein AYI69_g1489 [Smittium culicis]